MKVSPDARWDQALALIRRNVTEQIYNTWFKSIVFEQYDEAQKMILVQVPSPFVYEYLEENFVDLLGRVLFNCFGKGIRLSYRVVTDKEHNLSQDIEAEPTDAIDKPQGRSRANQSPTLLDAAQPQQLNPQLNPHLTFSNYVEGDSNKLPRSVGLSIAEHPNTMQFNPMFHYVNFMRELVIYGTFPGITENLICVAMSVLMLFAGFWVFYKKQDHFVLYI